MKTHTHTGTKASLHLCCYCLDNKYINQLHNRHVKFEGIVDKEHTGGHTSLPPLCWLVGQNANVEVGGGGGGGQVHQCSKRARLFGCCCCCGCG